MKNRILLYEVLWESTNSNQLLLAESLLKGKARATQELILSDINHPFLVPLLPLSLSTTITKYVCFKSEHRSATNSAHALSKLIANTCPPLCCLCLLPASLTKIGSQHASSSTSLLVDYPAPWKSCPKTLHEMPPTRQRERRSNFGTLILKGCQFMM